MSATTTLSWQADLLDAELRATVRRSPAPRGVLVPAVAVGIFLAAAAGTVQTMRGQMQDLRARAAVAKERIQTLERQAGAGNAEAQARNAAALEAEAARRRSLLAALKDAAATDDAAVTAAAVLTTLAQRHRDGMWLTRIDIDQARHELTIEGRVTDPRELAAYVAALGRDGSAVGGMAVDVVETKADNGSAASASASGAPAAPKALQFRIVGRHAS